MKIEEQSPPKILAYAKKLVVALLPDLWYVLISVSQISHNVYRN